MSHLKYVNHIFKNWFEILWGKLETVSVLKNFQNYTVLNLFSVFETEKYHNTSE